MIKIIARKFLPSLRSFIYKRGFRPKRDSIFFSPSLDVIYGLKQYVKHIKRK
ncbi:hypothetical protein PBI_SHEPARD_62 [Arthrobacter phage Shepard]|nr:hypothetical protein PBI_SHEPARD_62 [Arthrobacter phage Shepard]